MTLVAILVFVVLALLAFKFIKGVIKLGVLALIVLLGLFIAHHAGAF